MMDVTDWRNISKDPVCKEVHDCILQVLRNKRAGRIFDFMDFIKTFVEGKTVLDIGVVEHDIDHVESEAWKHKSIVKWSKSALGVDILSEELGLLKEKGFDVICADATSDTDLGRRFERVVICDVIEHVNHSVKLLEFANRHLTKNGKILVSTPNPFWFKYIWRNFKEGTFIPNAEHIAWISPSMALEIAYRAGVELDQYWLLQPHGKTVVKKLIHYLRDIILSESELMTPIFFYVFKSSNACK